jgi:aryl-alcohol dehydrogenase (NADP+)
MQYTKLGKTGVTVSRLCRGCMSYGGGTTPEWARGTHGWHVGKEDAREHFAIALEAGINFFDTADVYSIGLSEEITGAHLGEMASRDDIVVATKVHGPMGPGPNRRGLSRKHIIAACENSLRRLGMDYVDLYQIHRWDEGTPVEETLEALDSLLRAGKVRYVGASSMADWQLSKALYTARERGWSRFVSMQNHYNLIYREEEREMIPLCIDQGLAVIPWRPLARGFLTGSRRPEGGTTSRAQRHRRSGYVLQRRRFRGRRSGRGSGRTEGRLNGAGGLCVGPAGAGRDRADYWRNQAATSERTDRGGGSQAEHGRNRGTRNSLSASPRSRLRSANARGATLAAGRTP